MPTIDYRRAAPAAPRPIAVPFYVSAFTLVAVTFAWVYVSVAPFFVLGQVAFIVALAGLAVTLYGADRIRHAQLGGPGIVYFGICLLWVAAVVLEWVQRSYEHSASQGSFSYHAVWLTAVELAPAPSLIVFTGLAIWLARQ